MTDPHFQPTVAGPVEQSPKQTFVDDSSPQPLPSRPPFQEIPGFSIVKKLGAGGMGVVHLAEQEGMNRRFAIKLIRDDVICGSECAPMRGRRKPSCEVKTATSHYRFYAGTGNSARNIYSLDFICAIRQKG